MRRRLRNAFAVAGSLALGVWLASASGLGGDSGFPPPSISYRVVAEPDSGFAVELRGRGLHGRHPEFRLVDGWGLLQDQASHVRGVRAEDESGRAIGLEQALVDGEARWRLARRPRGEVVLRYRVDSFDPDLSPESSFTSRDRFLLLGYSLFLVPAGVPSFAPAPLDVALIAPKGWPLWASWPGSGRRFRPPTLHDLWSGVAAGGAFRLSRVEAGPVSVSVLTEAPIPDLLGLTVANRLFPGLREMVALFGASPRGDSLAVLAIYRVVSRREPMSMLSGCSEEGAFLCLATPDRFRDVTGLTTVATHECVHFYLGGAVAASGEPPYRNSPELVWLMEGVTEYLTYRLLEDAGSLPPGETERVARRKEREMLASAEPGLSLAEAARRMEDPRIYTLVYSRGFLVGRLLDRAMDARAPGAFSGALRDLFEAHNFYATQETITPEEARAAFEARCPGIGDLLDRFAIGTERLPRIADGPEGPNGVAMPTRVIQSRPERTSGAG